MKMKNILICLCLFYGSIPCSYGKQSAYLRISVADGVTLSDSCVLMLWHNHVLPSSRFEREDHFVFPTVNSPFEFSIPKVDYSMRLTLANNTIGLSLSSILVEPGDSVSIRINWVKEKTLDVTFSGPGSAKYQLVQELAQLRGHVSILWRNLEKYESSDALDQDIDNLYKLFLFTLDRFQTELSDTAYQILKADVLGYLHNQRLMLSANAYARSGAGFRKDFGQAFHKLIFGNEPLPYPEALLALSTEYIAYLYNREKIGLIYAFNPNFNKFELALDAPYSFDVLYNVFKNKYHSHLRDKLIAYLVVNSSDVIKFFKGVDSQLLADCLADALTILNEPGMLRLVNREYEAVAKGRQAYNFSLPNVDGEIVQMRDFQGKIVLLDFWGYGCGGCLSFKQRFEREVYPHLKDHPDFVFVSINADRKKETWLKALPTYSNPGFVNLGLYGLGNLHPLVQHYNVKAWPFVVLIGRTGEIVSATVPLGSEGLLRLINDQLNDSDR